jgi:hypothetical protein
LERVHKAAAVANLNKLPFFNEQHLRRIAGGDDMKSLLEDAKVLIQQKFKGDFTDEYITEVVKLMKVIHNLQYSS